MEWVKAENARSLKVLEADPRYAAFYADALKIAVAPDRLPEPEQRGVRDLQLLARCEPRQRHLSQDHRWPTT